MSGWGQTPWGTGPWGLGASSLTIAGAFAVSTHSVRVTLSTEPLHTDPHVVGDATNPATWTIQNLSTLFLFTVLTVVMVDAETFDVYTLEPFGNSLTPHRILSATLLTPDGDPISTPNSFDFAGVVDAALQVGGSR